MGAVFDYRSGRGGCHVAEMLEEFKGYVQTDRYSGYLGLFKPGSHRLSVACWAHARRKFTDVQKALGKKKKNGVVDYALKQIGKLYKIEKTLKADQSSDQVRQIYRQQYAAPILDKLHAFLAGRKDQAPPKSLLGKTINYTLNHWPALVCYLEDGALCIDNNPAEASIKPFAVGRKNWMFCGNTRAAKAAANIYSLIETAKQYDLKVFDYLKYVLEQIQQADTPRKYEKLLPMYAQAVVPKIQQHKNRQV